jgi:hypothetical protein
MLNKRFQLYTIIKQQKPEYYMNLQMDPLDNPLTTYAIQITRSISVQHNPNGQFGCTADSRQQFAYS